MVAAPSALTSPRDACTWIIATTLELFGDSFATNVTAQSVFSETLRTVYNAHSPTCKVRQKLKLHDDGSLSVERLADDWRSESAWIKANPMFGITPTKDWVRSFCADAQQTPGMEGEFRVKVCSQWMQAASSWLSMTRWDACTDTTMKLEDFKGQNCWIGADLAQLDDLAAVALVFEKAGILYVFVYFYLPRVVVEERGRTVPAYLQWANAGILRLTDLPMTDQTVIEADIRMWCKQFKVQAIVFDQFGSAMIQNRLEKDGLPAKIEPKNAATFTQPARELETRIKHGRLRHDGNPCLKWNASNVVVSRRIDDSILPKKESPESPNKIDGIDALLEALIPMLKAPQKPAFQAFVISGAR
jgi:phage terminase large subunit-like protein